jgi:hypothetical protein
VPGIYRPRHPERTVLYRVLFHHFERFVAEYESRFERDYGYFRPIVKDVVEKYLPSPSPFLGDRVNAKLIHLTLYFLIVFFSIAKHRF